MTTGVPHDDLFRSEEALRRGPSVLIADTEDPGRAAAIRRGLKTAWGQPMDGFGNSWWSGLREFERAYYEATTRRSFEEAELAYRRGYEVALHRNYQGRSYDEVAQELRERHGDPVLAEDFRRGYERGQVTQGSRSWWISSAASHLEICAHDVGDSSGFCRPIGIFLSLRFLSGTVTAFRRSSEDHRLALARPLPFSRATGTGGEGARSAAGKESGRP